MKVIVAGGGTGGHIYPALAIIKGIMAAEPSAQVIYVGSKKGLEAHIAEREGIEFYGISAAGIVGKSPIGAARGALRFLAGLRESLRVIHRFQPDVVVGTGGYASAPAVFAALLKRVPTAVQEQNIFPGLTNRLLARWVNLVFVPHEEARRYFGKRARIMVTGNPIRSEVLKITKQDGLKALGIQEGKPLVLIFGGSRGARSINNAFVNAWKTLIQIDACYLFVTGQRYYEEVVKKLGELGIPQNSCGNIILKPYLYEMHYAVAAADLIVSRAGAMTIAEITAVGVPAILIPSPNVAYNHQAYNASVLEMAGAAIVVNDWELTGERLAEEIARLLMDRARRVEMAAKSRFLGKPNALELIVSAVLELGRSRMRQHK